MATPLPICLKYEDSPKGGCVVNCKGVCLQRPIYNRQGPVYTTGEACSISSGNPEGSGKGSGDGDGGPDAPASGNSGSTAFPGWYNFEPVIGDATGTSVSGAVAKLNKNLGSALGMLAGNADLIYSAVSDIRGMSQRVVNASEVAQQFLKEISEYNRVANSRLEGAELVAARSEHYLEEIAKNTGGGSEGDGLGLEREYWDKEFDLVFGKFDLARANLYDIRMNTGSVIGEIFAIHGALGANGMAGQVMQMNETMQNLAAAISGGSIGSNTGGTTGGADKSSEYLKEINEVVGYMANDVRMLAAALPDGSGNGSGNGGGDGSGGVDIDYSKMPGSESTPLSVRSASYDSKGCEGGANCFFDLPTMQGKLDEANNALTGSYKAISEDMKRIFSFNFYGSAEPMKCLDLFSLYGKDYSVCPPSADFWSTLAALMMFIFYFVALMVIFKR